MHVCMHKQNFVEVCCFFSSIYTNLHYTQRMIYIAVCIACGAYNGIMEVTYNIVRMLFY